MNNTAKILSQFKPISLEKLMNAKLMNRVDTKFIFHLSDLPDILLSLKKDYHVLEVNNQRIAKYENLYFDTIDQHFYLDHHNKKDHRFKVRYRKYGNSLTTYFEIKERRKNRMHKQRVQVDKIQNELNTQALDLIEKTKGIPLKLEPKLSNHYQRITLVSESLKERFTMDFELLFQNGENKEHVDHIVIAELKQHRLDRKSPVFQVLNQKKIRTFRFSKYCIGTVLLYSREEVKYNNFKHIIQKLNTFKNAV